MFFFIIWVDFDELLMISYMKSASLNELSTIWNVAIDVLPRKLKPIWTNFIFRQKNKENSRNEEDSDKASEGNRVAEHSPHNPEVKGSSQAISADTGREKITPLH